MSPLTIFGIALALAMDAFAVSVASGFTIRRLHVHHALTIAAWFGTFQAVMPLLGWLGGTRMADLIGGVDHWVVFGLLSFVGGKMIYESRHITEWEERRNPLDLDVLFLMSFATSIDALAAGVSFAVLDLNIVGPVLVIGLVTFLVCLAGVWIGNRGGHVFENKLEAVGGMILIGIGLRVLVTHLAGG
jgi:putative Mn2+ efflux pump MntP